MRKVSTELQPSREILLTLKQNTAIHFLPHTQCIQHYSKSRTSFEFSIIQHTSKNIFILILTYVLGTDYPKNQR